MTDDTISRKRAIDAVRHSPIIEVQPAYMLIDKADVLKNIVMLPSAQRTGRWIYYPEINALSCSECKHYVYHYEPYKFCPNCGARMEEQE